MFFYHFCIIVSAIGAFISVSNENWGAVCSFIIALIVNGIYLIDDRIKDLKK